MIVEYFDHKNEQRLAIIGWIISCNLVIYVFICPTKRNITVLYYYTKYNRWYSRFINSFDTRGIRYFIIKYHIIESSIMFCWGISRIKMWCSKSSWWMLPVFHLISRNYISCNDNYSFILWFNRNEESKKQYLSKKISFFF